MDCVGGAQLFVLFLVLAKTSTGTSFNRSHVGVVFEPSCFIKDRTTAKLVTELVPPLSKIYSEFSKISLKFTDFEMTTIAVGLIPAAVASFNKNNLKVNESPIEVTIFIMKGDSRGKSLNHTALALEVTTIAANDANKVYPGTVQRIFIEHSDFLQENEDKEVREFEAYLANEDFTKRPFKYDLGAGLPLYYCRDDGIPQVLKHIQHISFSWWPDVKNEQGRYSRLRPKLAVEKLSKEFEECQQTIKEYGKDITIQIETGWPCSTFGPDGGDHDKNFVEYWEAINNWAVEANTTVLFQTAFDVVNGTHETVWDHNGWWKLIENQANLSNQIVYYTFVEKREGIAGTAENSGSHFSWRYRLALFIICVIIGIAFTIIFKRCDKYATNGIQPRCW